MRLDRPIGIWLLLWPALWALWISADGRPDERIFVIFLIGTFVMRSAGCVINDFADREFDPHVRRTANRPLARGASRRPRRSRVFAVLGLIALALLIPLNRPTQVLALVGGVLAVTYPFLKRFFALPQAYLGLAFQLVRADGVRRADRRVAAGRLGAVRAPACCGRRRTTRSTRWSTARTTSSSASARRRSCSGARTAASSRAAGGHARGCWRWPAHLTQLGRWYWLGSPSPPRSALHQQYLIRRRDPHDCFRAFLNNNLFGLAVFGGILLDYLFRA